MLKFPYTILSISNKSLKNPGLRKERTVFVRVQWTNSVDKSASVTNSSSDRSGSFGNLDPVERVGEGLVAWLEAIEASTNHIRDSAGKM